MKRSLTLLLMLLPLAIMAQNTSDAKEKVASIRAKYNEAKEMAAKKYEKEDEFLRHDMDLTYRRILPGSGPSVETMHFYYTFKEIDAEEDLIMYFTPYLITRKYNLSSREYYEELLYDTDHETLIFAYAREKDEDIVNEVRYYWDYNENGTATVINKIEKGKAPFDSETIVKHSKNLTEAFSKLQTFDNL